MNYLVRNISNAVDEAMQALIGNVTRGQASQRQARLHDLIDVYVLGLDISEYVYSLWISSQRIAAKRNRGERDSETLSGLLRKEYAEFDQSEGAPLVKRLTRMSNVLYYLVQDYVQDGDIKDFHASCTHIASKLGLSEEQALRIAEAKFRDRSRRELGEKDVAAEEAAMLYEYEKGEYQCTSDSTQLPS